MKTVSYLAQGWSCCIWGGNMIPLHKSEGISRRADKATRKTIVRLFRSFLKESNTCTSLLRR